MGLFRFVPVMWAPALIYSVIALTMGSGAAAWFDKALFAIRMPTGDPWTLSNGGALVIAGLLCLSIEIVRTGIASGRSLVINSLVATAIVPCIVLFLLVRGFGTTEFFLIILMMLLDFLTDSVVLVLTARRTVDVEPR